MRILAIVFAAIVAAFAGCDDQHAPTEEAPAPSNYIYDEPVSMPDPSQSLVPIEDQIGGDQIAIGWSCFTPEEYGDDRPQEGYLVYALRDGAGMVVAWGQQGSPMVEPAIIVPAFSSEKVSATCGAEIEGHLQTYGGHMIPHRHVDERGVLAPLIVVIDWIDDEMSGSLATITCRIRGEETDFELQKSVEVTLYSRADSDQAAPQPYFE